mmetsp:Transcript_1583/g.4751  ORF Transcript_1583/g.4751 Transcript_1583/m.4751 type:complete len:168 (+) Transcript_1583:899-1402(+)
MLLDEGLQTAHTHSVTQKLTMLLVESLQTACVDASRPAPLPTGRDETTAASSAAQRNCRAVVLHRVRKKVSGAGQMLRFRGIRPDAPKGGTRPQQSHLHERCQNGGVSCERGQAHVPRVHSVPCWCLQPPLHIMQGSHGTTLAEWNGFRPPGVPSELPAFGTITVCC